MTRLNGKVAIVTGAAQGIGKAIVLRLAAEGAKVALADVQLDSAEQSAAEIRSSGANAIAIRLDVTELDEALAAADRVERDLGPIDILVNNAGWDVVQPFLETGPDLWDKLIAINFRGILNCCKAVAPRMQSRGAGKIVSISSDAARVGSTGEERITSMSMWYARVPRKPRCSKLRWRDAKKFSNQWRAAFHFVVSDSPPIWQVRSRFSLRPIRTSLPAKC